MISHPSYEKVGHLTIKTFIKNILFKLIPNFRKTILSPFIDLIDYHTIYLSCISCFGSFASGNIRHKEFDKLAFTPNFNIIQILLQNIQEALKMNKDQQHTPKSEKIPDSTILLESLIILSKFPKHFVGHFL